MISNLTVCDVCVFHAAVFGKVKLFGVLWFLVIFSKVPLIKPLAVIDRSKPNCDIMRYWVSAFEAAVRQRGLCH